jgi:hypothetical protein
MRIVVILAALALLAGCGEEDDTEQPASAPPKLAELTITVKTDEGAEPKTTEVTCAAPEDSEVCQALAALDPDTLKPVPGNVACTQQYGGPETATIKGTLNGEPVDASFSRVNGCEITRWNTAKAVFEAAG